MCLACHSGPDATGFDGAGLCSLPRIGSDRKGAMRDLVARLWTDESGQDLAEYALLIGLIALVVIVAVRILGGTIRETLWGPIVTALQEAT